MHPQPYHLLSVLSLWSVYLFYPIYHPWEHWLEVQSFTNTGKLVNRIWVNDPNKPMSIYFDVCATVAENTGPWGNCGKGPIG
jgi:hypothetical protein